LIVIPSMSSRFQDTLNSQESSIYVLFLPLVSLCALIYIYRQYYKLGYNYAYKIERYFEAYTLTNNATYMQNDIISPQLYIDLPVS
jgi:hypothetical protein